MKETALWQVLFLDNKLIKATDAWFAEVRQTYFEEAVYLLQDRWKTTFDIKETMSKNEAGTVPGFIPEIGERESIGVNSRNVILQPPYSGADM